MLPGFFRFSAKNDSGASIQSVGVTITPWKFDNKGERTWGTPVAFTWTTQPPDGGAITPCDEVYDNTVAAAKWVGGDVEFTYNGTGTGAVRFYMEASKEGTQWPNIAHDLIMVIRDASGAIVTKYGTLTL